MSKFKQLAN